jgi:20S proteasome alpha/beta subunit
MSIIVFKEGVMAADGLLCTSHWQIHTDRHRKIYKLVDGSLFGATGTVPVIEAFVRRLNYYIADHKEDPLRQESVLQFDRLRAGDDKSSGLRGMLNGRIISYEAEGVMLYPRAVKYQAIGAGCDIAIGAMDMGATAAAACRLAIKRNMGTRGKVFTLRVGKDKP